MNEATLIALKQSIEKWKQNAIATEPNQVAMGPKSCPLCVMYNTDGMPREKLCTGCPVFEKVGNKYCSGSPYVDAISLRSAWRWGHGEGDEFRAAAQKEVEFLESLLPEEAK